MRFPKTSTNVISLSLVALLLLFACNKENRKAFDLSTGPAAVTLKEFAEQAEIEILFDPKQVETYRTQAVAGDFTPEQTLELMLRGTQLEFSVDPKTHAYAVYRPDLNLGGESTP